MDLYRRGRPTNTLRAWDRDLLYITAWKQAAFGGGFDCSQVRARTLITALFPTQAAPDSAPLPAARLP